MVEDWKVKDIGLAGAGEERVRWTEAHMPVLMKIRERFSKEEPLEDLVISACLHVTTETAVLAKTLQAGGADVALCGSNPLSTQDDAAAYLASIGIHTFAWRGETEEEYFECIDKVLAHKPDVVHDDGADLIVWTHEKQPDLAEKIIAGMEETTTGVIRLRNMERDGVLKFPIIAVNDTPSKALFDNVHGTGQSTLDGIVRATGILLAGKTIVVAGYGRCGSGIAKRAEGMGANVIVCEVDPIKALQAVMDGYRVMPMPKAAEVGDVFVTATGCRGVIRKEHMLKMKDGAISCNSGHFNVEVSKPDLEEISVEKKRVGPCVDEYRLKDGRRIYLLGEGRLVNLVCASGHPASVMDLSFGNQALMVEYVVKNKDKLEPRVYSVPDEIDSTVARLKLKTMGIEIDELTPEQKEYLRSWRLGT